MAIDFITVTVDANKTQSTQLKNFTALVAQVYGMAAQIRNKMTHMYNGADFTMLETEFGIPSGKGQEVFDLLNGSVNAMDGTMQNSNLKTITEKLG
jgi:hypothetical protein